MINKSELVVAGVTVVGVVLLTMLLISSISSGQYKDQRIMELASQKTCLAAGYQMGTIHGNFTHVTCFNQYGGGQKTISIDFNTTMGYEMCSCCTGKTTLGNVCKC